MMKNSFDSREDDKLKHVLLFRSTTWKPCRVCFSLPREFFSTLLEQAAEKATRQAEGLLYMGPQAIDSSL